MLVPCPTVRVTDVVARGMGAGRRWRASGPRASGVQVSSLHPLPELESDPGFAGFLLKCESDVAFCASCRSNAGPVLFYRQGFAVISYPPPLPAVAGMTWPPQLR